MTTYPKMLVMRNSIGGMIWQAYRVVNEQEQTLLTKSATKNGFIVEEEAEDYTDESTPGWRNTREWKDYVAGRLSPRAQGQERVRAVLKDIRRDGPYWLGGYHDWLVSCFSLRDLNDLHGFTPIACYSELVDRKVCHQWMLCKKDGVFYVDHLQPGRTDYGLKPVPVDSITYPPHIFDWIKEITKG